MNNRDVKAKEMNNQRRLTGHKAVSRIAPSNSDTSNTPLNPQDRLYDLETMQFDNYDESSTYIVPNTTLYDHTFDGIGNGEAARLTGADGLVVGPAKSLYVTSGDTVQMEVFAKWTDNGESGNKNTGIGGIIAGNITSVVSSVVCGVSRGNFCSVQCKKFEHSTAT